MIKKLLGLGIAFLMLFSLTACNEFDLESYKAEAKQEIESYSTESNYIPDNWSVICGIVDEGKAEVQNATSKSQVYDIVDKVKEAIDMVFFEIEVDDMIECSRFRYHIALSSLGTPIELNHQDESVFFKCIVDKGVIGIFGDFADSCTLKAGDGLYWMPENDAAKIQQAYIDILLLKDDLIIGYAVVEIIANEPYDNHSFYAKLIKSALFPKIDGKSQNMTQRQLNTIITKTKEENK